MGFSGQDIKHLRQRLGWSLAEMGRRMGCGIELIQAWENEGKKPDAETINQLHYLQNHLDSYSEQIAQKPRVEKEMEERRMAQLTHRDLLKDIQ